MNSVESVLDFYNQDPQREWLRLERHRTELALTMRALNHFLPPPPAAILDCGGGPGRYAIALAAQGYQVTLLDLAPANLALARERAAATGVRLSALIEADVRDLSALTPAAYDGVLLMGPLYHLRQESERRTAVDQVKRVLKDRGLIFAAFITRFAPIARLASTAPERLDSQWHQIVSILDDGYDPWTTQFPNAYFARPEEIVPFMESAAFDTRLLLNCEGIIAEREERVNELSGAAWQRWLELNYRLGQEPSLYGAAEHLLYCGRLCDRTSGRTVEETDG